MKYDSKEEKRKLKLIPFKTRDKDIVEMNLKELKFISSLGFNENLIRKMYNILYNDMQKKKESIKNTHC